MLIMSCMWNTLALPKMVLFFSVNLFRNGANTHWDNILKFQLYYQNMLSFITNGSTKHTWFICLFKLRSTVGNEGSSYSASKTTFLCTLKPSSFLLYRDQSRPAKVMRSITNETSTRAFTHTLNLIWKGSFLQLQLYNSKWTDRSQQWTHIK